MLKRFRASALTGPDGAFFAVQNPILTPLLAFPMTHGYFIVDVKRVYEAAFELYEHLRQGCWDAGLEDR